MDEYFTQLDCSQIAGQPHRLPDKAVEKLPMYMAMMPQLSPCISQTFPDASMPMSVIL